MTLDNLIGLGLEAIRHDASITLLSNETRFDTAYKAVMQIANAALQAEGFRTSTIQQFLE